MAVSMKRILIIGCGGAGKSTFAKKLSGILHHELIHLDMLYWKGNWIPTPSDTWTRIVRSVIKKREWIMDGNYSGTLPMRLKRADTVIYFDFPTVQCLWNAALRVIKGRFLGARRSDVPETCRERFDLDFFSWIFNYNRKHRARFMALLSGHKNRKNIFIIRGYAEANALLDRIGAMNGR
ncbi:MAG: hypothetical protein AABZ39_08795 [Spirochaetota bacterium]